MHARDDYEQNNHGSAGAMTRVFSVFVRLIGVVLLLVGLWLSLQVIREAWDLYRAPERIERFAQAIERGSNIDKIFILPSSAPKRAEADESDQPRLSADPIDRTGEPFRPSYFMAWGIALLLLMLIGRLALAAVKTGGELALYDTEVRRFARALIQETRGSSIPQRREMEKPASSPAHRLGSVQDPRTNEVEPASSFRAGDPR
jgi:hypothetical protein